MVESTKTINWVSKLDSQLYPVITTNATNPKDVAAHLEQKLETVLPEIKRAQGEVEQRIKTAEGLIAKTPSIDEQSLNVKNKLIELNQKLVEITTDYQILLQMLIGYFNNVKELDKTIDNLNAQFNKTLPNDVGTVELLIREHDGSKQAILEMFKFTQNECEKLISRIYKQEPRGAAEHDIEKLHHVLEIPRNKWETEWHKTREILEAHRQLCQFDSDLNQINETVDDLSRQVSEVKGHYGESLSGAKATSQAFGYFEKTVEMLGQRIETFVNGAAKLLADRHIQSPHIEFQVRKLKDRWNQLKKEVEDTRRAIDLSIQYFQLVEEAVHWFKQGSHLLVTIARKSTTVKKPEEAQQLLNEIENFLKPGEAQQNERLNQISSLANQIYGPQFPAKSSQVEIDNREMLDSFTSITNELRTLTINLQTAEEDRERAKREQEEADARLAAAKAEADAARAAAQAAEEAKRAAEEAKRLAEIEGRTISEQTFTKAIEMVKITQLQQEIPVVSPAKLEERIEPTLLQSPIFISPLSDAVIQEGSKFTFICQVTGEPQPVVVWYKDGIAIQNNPDYQTSFDQGLCTLTIEETFAEDSARYTCKASNAAGVAETGAFLTVKETQPDEQLIPPNFVKLLEPAFVKHRQGFQFECRVEGNPLPTVQWFKNNDCIDNSPDYIITYNNGDAVLRFEEVAFEDKADYTCKASNQVGTAQTTANLFVEASEPTETPRFIIPLSNVMARAGQKIKLECEVSGLPTPSLTWSHNGKPVKETRELKFQSDGKRATLVISEAFPKDAGTYVVTAINPAGESTSACNVTVKGRLPTETSDSELASDMEPIKPSIQVPLKDVSIFDGKKVCLDCVIIGQPEPEVIWYHDDRPVKESPDFQLLFQGDRCSLVIREAYAEDAGEYKVVALNSAGEASSKCTLTVTPLTDANKPPQEESKPTGSPPKFSKLLSDVLVSEGDKVIFEATVTGEPRPEIKWLLNNQDVQDGQHMKLSHDEQGNVRLEIEKVVPEDKGVYTVKAVNSCGDAKCFSQLIVKSFKPLEVQKEYEEVKSAPVFKETFSDRIAFEDTATKFECIVTGKPTPKIKWLFNDEAVAGKDFLISTSGERQVLSIPKLGKENSGKITCLAENETGKASCTASLTVQPTMDVSLPENIKTESQHAEDSSSSYSSKREVFVQSSTSSTSKIVTNTSMAEPKVEVHGYVSQDAQSFKQINQQPPEVKESHVVEQFHKVGKEPPVVQEKTISTMSMGGESKTQQITSSEQSSIQKIVIKARPPKFTSPIVGKIVDQGVDVTLEGIIDGSPSPTVSWAKNGVEIQSGGNIEVTYENNRVRISLKNVSTSDSGRYTCTAVNEAGTAVSTSDLVVRKTIFPPVFGRRLQAQVVKKNERVRMEIEVTGTPVPTVTWFKDDKPIKEVLKDGFRITKQGNSHTLIIEKADFNHTGKYMARAVNEGGEAQSIADFAVFEPTPDTMVEVVKTVVFEDVHKHETLAQAADQTKATFTSPKPIPPIELPKFEAPALIKPTQSFSQSSETHKTMSSKSEISTVTETKISQESKIIKMESSTGKPTPEISAIPIIVEKKTSTEISHQIPIDTTQEDTGIQTSSISKQSSLDFFVQKMKESEEPVKPKELAKATPLPTDIYTKFEDVSKKTEVIYKPDLEILKLPEYQPPVMEVKPSIPSYQPPVVQHESSYTKETRHFESKQFSQPEIKLPEYQPPVMEVKLPTYQPLYQAPPAEVKPTYAAPKVPQYQPPVAEYKPAVPTYQQQKTVVHETKRFEETSKPEIVSLPEYKSPVMGLEDNKPAYKPFTEQKSFSSKQVEEKQFRQFSSSSTTQETFNLQPEPPAEECYEEPTRKVQTKALKIEETCRNAPPPKPTGLTTKYLRTDSSLLRSVSPKPSTEGLEMEKLWVPHTDAPRPVSVASSYYSAVEKQSRPISALSEPSTEGIQMEKSWAHKFSETHTESSWPPPTPPVQETKSWSAQTTLEKKWAPIQTKTESSYTETKIINEPAPAPVMHYIAKVTDLHETEFTQTMMSSKTEVVEESSTKASEIIKSWPPAPPKAEEPKPVYKPVVPSIHSLSIRPASVQDITNEVYLEPGPPAEIVYVPPPQEPRYQAPPPPAEIIYAPLPPEPKYEAPPPVKIVYVPPPRVEPTYKAPPVRVVAPPLPPKQERPQAPPLPARPIKPIQAPQKKIIHVESKPFEKFPDLEPFPFKPDPDRPRHQRVPPPPTPSKFIKGRFADSDYESDFEAVRIPAKWKPCSSDTEEPSYRKVRAPKLAHAPRSKSVEPEPLPPSKFEQPPHGGGPLRPTITSEDRELLKKQRTATQVKKQVRHYQRAEPVIKKGISPPPIKPGTPPEYVQVAKPESPKFKPKIVVDGYMADTDEPFTLRKKTSRHEETSKHEYHSTSSMTSESSQQKVTFESHSIPKPAPPKVYRKHVSSSTASKKELVSTPIITSVSMSEKIIHHDDRDSSLEPFPFQAEASRPRRPKGPPPPSPSKFVKGEFRESDYESEYEGRIPPVWRSDAEPYYKPVRPVLTPSGRQSHGSGRTPTPPTAFDNPPQFSGPPRPKFEPIEKPKPSVKLNEILSEKTSRSSQIVHKPKPVTPRVVPVMDVIVATPAAPILQPGSPPEMAYAPGPNVTQYYRSTTTAPYQNAVQTETSNVMHFKEHTEHSQRTVSVQQTRKVITFGGKEEKHETVLEPLPFKPEPERPRRSVGQQAPTPKRFIRGEFRESDYDSEIETTRIKSLWTPGLSDTDEPRYRKVRAPAEKPSYTPPSTKERILSPLDFDNQPPVVTRTTTTDSSSSSKQFSGMNKRFESSQMISKYTKASQPPEPILKPGSPPEFGYVPEKITKATATKIASKHMDDMTHTFKSKTQQFVSDIISDVNKKPAVKKSTNGDAQVYREESRAAQYGTKHVDPDTGLIYFKYDFGYEFGIILPGQSKGGEIPVPKKTIIEPPKRSGDIEMPVYHETTKPNKQTPSFRPTKINVPKTVKWEPTSESEMSEYEGDAKKRVHLYSPWEQSSVSPISLSPSLPSTSPAFNTAGPRGVETPTSTPSTPGSMGQNSAQPKRPPLFITPLRDIAVVSGQTARFECIVQSEPPPNILWSKNGRIIANSNDHQIHFRNGVCRLTIPQAFPEDAGTYTCTATNQIGAVGTTATLQVPGERRSQYI